MGPFTRTEEQKLRSDLFFKRTFPLLIFGLVIGYTGIKVIHSIFAGARYEYFLSYIWIAVFFIGFIFANQILVVQQYQKARKEPSSPKKVI